MTQTEKPIEERIYKEVLDTFKSVSYDDVLFQQAYLDEVTSIVSPFTNEDKCKIKKVMGKSDFFYYDKMKNLFKLRAGITYEDSSYSEAKNRILTVSAKNLKTPSLDGGFKFRIKAFNVSCVNEDMDEKRALMLFRHEFKTTNPTLSYGLKKARKFLNRTKYFEEIDKNSYVPTEVDLIVDIDFKTSNMTINGIPFEECPTNDSLRKMMNFISEEYSTILRTIFPYGLEAIYCDVMNKLPDKLDVFTKLYSSVIYISNKKYFIDHNQDGNTYNTFSYKDPIFKEFEENGKQETKWTRTVKAIKENNLVDILKPEYKRAFALSLIESHYKTVYSDFIDLQKLINSFKSAKEKALPSADKKSQTENIDTSNLKGTGYRKNFVLPIFPKIVKNRSDLITYLNEERFNDFNQVRNNLYRPYLVDVITGIREKLERIPTNLKEYGEYINANSREEYSFNRNYGVYSSGKETTALNLIEASLLIGSKNMADILYHYLYQDKNILETSYNDNYQILCYIDGIIDLFSNYRFRKDNEYYLEENITTAPYNVYTGFNVGGKLKDEYTENRMIMNQFSYYYFEAKKISYEKVYKRLCDFNSKYIRSLIDSNNWPNMEPLLATLDFREDRKKLDQRLIQLVPKLSIRKEFITGYPVKKESDRDKNKKLYPKFIDVFDKRSNKYIGSIYLKTTDSYGKKGEPSSSIFLRSEYERYYWKERLETTQRPLYLYRFGNKPASDLISKYIHNNDVQFTITYNKPNLAQMFDESSNFYYHDGSSDFYYQIRGSEYYDEYLPSAYSNIDSFYFVRENGKMISVKSQSYREFDKFSEVKLTKEFPRVYKDLIENKIIEIKREV